MHLLVPVIGDGINGSLNRYMQVMLSVVWTLIITHLLETIYSTWHLKVLVVQTIITLPYHKSNLQ